MDAGADETRDSGDPDGARPRMSSKRMDQIAFSSKTSTTEE